MERITKFTTESHIHSIIKQLLENRALLKIRVGSESDIYTSVIINVSVESGYLILDDLFPALAIELIPPGTTLEVHSQHNGATVAFTTEVIETGEDAGILYHKVNYPDQLRYHQKRNAYRLPLKGIKHLSAKVNTSTFGNFSGQIEDISVNGVCISFNEKEILKIPTEQLINECIIELTGQTLACAIKVCHSQMASSKDKYLLRCQFSGLLLHQENRLHKEITKLQREQIRLTKRKDDLHPKTEWTLN